MTAAAMAEPARRAGHAAPAVVLAVMLGLWTLLAALATGAAAQEAAQEAAPEPPTARIGVLAYRGVDRFQSDWRPFEAHLSDRLEGWQAELVPVTLDSAEALLREGRLHFLVTNPGHYIQLSASHSLSPVATRVRRTAGGVPVTHFGSAIITAAASPITRLEDVEGARLVAVAPDAFGGLQAAWQTFHDRGISLLDVAGEVIYTGFPMDQVIAQVQQDPGAVGLVRSGMIEALEAAGTLAPGQLRVLNANTTFTHPEAVSTALYPEWPLLATAAATGELRRQMARVAIWEGDPAVPNSTWTVPLAYDQVRAVRAAFAEAAAGAPAGGIAPGWLAAVALLALAVGAGGALVVLRGRAGPGPGRQAVLTPRQRQILELVSAGKTSKEIASSIGVSVKTVEFHRTNLLRKFEVDSTAELVAKLREEAS